MEDWRTYRGHRQVFVWQLLVGGTSMVLTSLFLTWLFANPGEFEVHHQHEAFTVETSVRAPMMRVQTSGGVNPLDPLGKLLQPICVDGTPAMYYFRPAEVRDARDENLRWVIHLGGSNSIPPTMEWDTNKHDQHQQQQHHREDNIRHFADDFQYTPFFTCHSLDSCDRSLLLSSSDSYPQQIYAHGILADDITENPEFFDANHVFIPYCSADLWLGSSKLVSKQEARTLNFRGREILLSVIVDLLNHGMDDAREILLSGTNEGGLGVVFALDVLHEILPSTAYVMALNDGGLLFDHVEFDHKSLFDAFEVWDAPSCLASTQSSQSTEFTPGSTPRANQTLSEAELRRLYDCTAVGANFDSVFIGDGFCDSDYNIAPCFDGGDCCKESCLNWASKPTQCGEAGYECIDPHFSFPSTGQSSQGASDRRMTDLYEAFSCYIGWDKHAMALKIPTFHLIPQFTHFQLSHMSLPSKASAERSVVDVFSHPSVEQRDAIVAFVLRAARDLQDLISAALLVRDSVAQPQSFGSKTLSTKTKKSTDQPPKQQKQQRQQQTPTKPKQQATGSKPPPATNKPPPPSNKPPPPSNKPTQPPASNTQPFLRAAQTGAQTATTNTNPPGTVDQETLARLLAALKIRGAAEGLESLDIAAAAAASTSPARTNGFGFGINLGHVWQTPIPAPSMRVGVWSPMCGAPLGVLHPKIFTDLDSQIDGVSFKQAFERYYFQRPLYSELQEKTTAKQIGQKSVASDQADETAPQSLENGIHGNSETGEVMLFVEPLTRCTHCAVAYTERALHEDQMIRRLNSILEAEPSKNKKSAQPPRREMLDLVHNLASQLRNQPNSETSQQNNNPGFHNDLLELLIRVVEDQRQQQQQPPQQAPASETQPSIASSGDHDEQEASRVAAAREILSSWTQSEGGTAERRAQALENAQASSSSQQSNDAEQTRAQRLFEFRLQQIQEHSRQTAEDGESGKPIEQSNGMQEGQVRPRKRPQRNSSKSNSTSHYVGEQPSSASEYQQQREQERVAEIVARHVQRESAREKLRREIIRRRAEGKPPTSSATTNSGPTKLTTRNVAAPLVAIPALTRNKFLVQAGQLGEFSIENPNLQPVQLTAIVGAAKTTDSKKQSDVFLRAGIDATVLDSTTDKQQVIMAKTICASFNVTRSGNGVLSLQTLKSDFPVTISGVPFPILVEPGEFDAIESTITGINEFIKFDVTKHKQKKFSFKITARDRFGNILRHGGDTVYCRMVGPVIIFPTIVDHLNGTYTASAVVNTPGIFRVEVLLLRIREGEMVSGVVKGQHIAQSPYRVDFMASPISTDKPINEANFSPEMTKQRRKVAKNLPSCAPKLHANRTQSLGPGLWVHRNVIQSLHGETHAGTNATHFGEYRWTFDSCIPALIGPSLCEKCLEQKWIHIIGDATSRDLYRLFKALLISAEDLRTATVETLQTFGPSLSWWMTQRGNTFTSRNVIGYDRDLVATRSWVYRFSNQFNTTLSWAPLLDTAENQQQRTDSISRLAEMSQQPDAVIISVPFEMLCSMRPHEFAGYTQSLMTRLQKVATGRVIWLLPPAVHDTVYRERFSACSFRKIQEHVNKMKTVLGSRNEVIDLWQLTAPRVDATSDGTRYVWATEPEPIHEDVSTQETVQFESSMEGFRGAVGWGISNLVLNHLCAADLVSPTAINNQILSHSRRKRTKTSWTVVFSVCFSVLAAVALFLVGIFRAGVVERVYRRYVRYHSTTL